MVLVWEYHSLLYSIIPLSLIFSLIYKLFVLFNTHFCKWEKTTFLYQVNLAVELFTQ